MTQPSSTGDRTLAAVAYVLTWITGLIIFFIAKKDDKYARWHAIQAIIYGIAVVVIGALIGFLGIGFLGRVFWILVIVGIVVLAVKAYQGEKIRLPLAADIADRNA